MSEVMVVDYMSWSLYIIGKDMFFVMVSKVMCEYGVCYFFVFDGG